MEEDEGEFEFNVSDKLRVFVHDDVLFLMMHVKICPSPDWVQVNEKGEPDFFVCKHCSARYCPEHDEFRIAHQENVDHVVAIMGKLRKIPFAGQLIFDPEGMCYEFEKVISIIRECATQEQPIGIMFVGVNEASIHRISIDDADEATDETEDVVEGYA